MPISSVTSDPDALTLTLVGDYAATVERLWDAWADPRQLERFWGPPTWPATFTRHDMTSGGRAEYHMTGPNGETSAGYWVFQSVEPGRSIHFVDGFADADGDSVDALPLSDTLVTFETTPNGSRFTATTTFSDLASMEQLAAMGMVEGITSALGQLDAVIEDLAAFAAGDGTRTQFLSDTVVRVSRVVRGTVEDVWRAHHDADLMRRWMLGPDGWSMPVCDVASAVGDTYRYEWEADDGSARFGFTGECLEMIEPTRSVTTERMIDTDGPSTVNELTLTPVDGGSLISLVITYPTVELRDEILATGMTDGMEDSYRRLESILVPA